MQLTYQLVWVKVIADYLQKNADISKIKRILVVKVYFLKLHVCVLTYQVLSFYHNLWSIRQGGLFLKRRTPKKPTLIRLT